MINKIINPIKQFKTDDVFKPIKNTTRNNLDIKVCADSFLKNMSDLDKKKLKNMIDKGYFSGENIAKDYGVDPNGFLESLKLSIKN